MIVAIGAMETMNFEQQGDYEGPTDRSERLSNERCFTVRNQVQQGTSFEVWRLYSAQME